MRGAFLFFRAALLVPSKFSHTRRLSNLNDAGKRLIDLSDDVRKTPMPQAAVRHAKFIYPLMAVLGVTVVYQWFTTAVDKPIELLTPTVNIESALLISVRQERIRLEKNHHNSFTDNRALAWVTGSKGYVHWKKIEVLKQAEKELDKTLGGSGKLTEETLAQLSAAYASSPEEADKLFKEKYLETVSSELRLKK